MDSISEIVKGFSSLCLLTWELCIWLLKASPVIAPMTLFGLWLLRFRESPYKLIASLLISAALAFAVLQWNLHFFPDFTLDFERNTNFMTSYPFFLSYSFLFYCLHPWLKSENLSRSLLRTSIGSIFTYSMVFLLDPVHDLFLQFWQAFPLKLFNWPRQGVHVSLVELPFFGLMIFYIYRLIRLERTLNRYIGFQFLLILLATNITYYNHSLFRNYRWFLLYQLLACVGLLIYSLLIFAIARAPKIGRKSALLISILLFTETEILLRFEKWMMANSDLWFSFTD